MLCLNGAAAGGTLLYRDMTGTGMSGQGAPIAQVLQAEKRVKRRLASSYIWNAVQAEQQLFRRESVQTGPESQAVIRLADGTTVEVRENSLVVIDETKNLMNSFIQGSLILHQESGDSVMTAGSDGTVQIRELTAQLLSPSLSEIFFTTKGIPTKIHFEWKLRSGPSPERNSPIAVQISRDASFQKLQTLTDPTAELPTGRHYWRIVQTKDGQREEPISAVAQFSVVKAAPLTLTAPSDGERVEFFGDQATLEFRWVDRPGHSGKRSANVIEKVDHQLEISDDPKFEKIIAAKRVSASSQIARMSGLPMGSLFWRIRSKWGPVNVESPMQTFRIERAARLPIELLTPRDEATLPESPLRLSWRGGRQGAESRYSVEVESTIPGRKFSKVESTHSGGISMASLSPGAYRWRVKAFSNTDVSGESEWRDFSIARGGAVTLKTPLLNQRIVYWKDPIVFRFQWEPDLLVTTEGSANTYELELSDQADFRNPTMKKQSRAESISSSEIALKPGAYHWRLKVLDESGAVLKTSTPFQFTYGTHPVLGVPATASPAHETKLNPLDLETDPVLSWSSVEGAVSYELVVTRQVRNEKRLWLRQVTADTSITLKDAPEGIYTWSVRALDPLDRLGDALSERKLILDAGEPLAPPKTLTQEVQ